MLCFNAFVFTMLHYHPTITDSYSIGTETGLHPSLEWSPAFSVNLLRSPCTRLVPNLQPESDEVLS